MLKGNETLHSVITGYPFLVEEFEKLGLGDYCNEDNIAKTGKYIKLSTLCYHASLKQEAFLAILNNRIDHEKIDETTPSSIHEHLDFMAMLPCGLRNPFKDYLETHITENEELYEELNYLAEGNVNHELSYYPTLDKVYSAEELPDIILASDVNNFFHKPFMKKFVEKDVFNAYTLDKPHPYLENAGYSDPAGHFTMLTSNLLVMAVDTEKLGSRLLPETWEDILHESFENDIIMRGEDDFYCNAIMLPFYKDHGFDAIRSLARNIKGGKHPSEMVKLAGAGNPEGAAIYIMPYFFAKKIKSTRVKLVWPVDGAIASPVFLLAQKSKIAKHAELLKFLIGKEMGDLLETRHFPSTHADAKNDFPSDSVKWLGWEFIYNNDIGELKEAIQKEFKLATQQKATV